MDDLLGGGDEVFDRTILEFKREFGFGAHLSLVDFDLLLCSTSHRVGLRRVLCDEKGSSLRRSL